ncbi:hypothetical protein [Nocardia brasiliensis]|uniref:hypothetical protein n=1 Tax=Nocardia brasiliensis TaxID=37326 RepID=UPI0024581B3D|nr:hypothetical protein [Nocardia brasiliensis]
MSDTEAGDNVQMQAMVTRWQALYKQAEGGELRVDEEIGLLLADRAEQMRIKLRKMADKAGDLEHTSGFGTLASAQALQNKFGSKANGSSDSAVTRIQQSMDVVALMRDTYRLACGKLSEVDKSAADKLAGLDMGSSQ